MVACLSSSLKMADLGQWAGGSQSEVSLGAAAVPVQKQQGLRLLYNDV